MVWRNTQLRMQGTIPIVGALQLMLSDFSDLQSCSGVDLSIVGFVIPKIRSAKLPCLGWGDISWRLPWSILFSYSTEVAPLVIYYHAPLGHESHKMYYGAAVYHLVLSFIPSAQWCIECIYFNKSRRSYRPVLKQIETKSQLLASNRENDCNTIKLREHPKALTTKSVGKPPDGLLGYGKNVKDTTMDNPQPSPKLGALYCA